MKNRKPRLAKKLYLDGIYFDITARHLMVLAFALKDDRSITAICQLRKLFKSQLKDRGNPYFQATRLEEYIRDALEISERI